MTIHMTTDAKPMPCPACQTELSERDRDSDGAGHYVECSACGMTGPKTDGIYLDAIAAWNALPRPTPTLPADVAAIKERLEAVSGEWVRKYEGDGCYECPMCSGEGSVGAVEFDRPKVPVYIQAYGIGEEVKKHGDFIEHAPGDLAALLSSLEAAQAENERLHAREDALEKALDEPHYTKKCLVHREYQLADQACINLRLLDDLDAAYDQRDDLARRLAESGAGCAVMREALEQADAELPACPYCSGERRGRAIEAVNAALSTTAGRALLDELEGLRSINVSVSSVVKLLLAYFKGRDCRENLHIEDGTGEYHGDIGYLELLDLFVALDARKGKGKE